MQPFFEDLFDRLQELHVGIERAIEGLPQAALDWIPGPVMNSLCVLVEHVAGAERYWIGDVVAGEPSGRDRDAEFLSKGLDEANLKERLSDGLEHCQGVLEKLTLKDLERSCV